MTMRANLKESGLILMLIACMASCGYLEKKDNDDKVKTECPKCHYCSYAKIKEECAKYRAR